MKLELSEAISIILALPAHRSNNKGHQVLGQKALDFLLEYRELGDDIERAFNRAMIASVMSSVRAFSVERDRLASEWSSMERVGKKRETLVDDLRNISPLSKGNYLINSLVLIAGLLGVKFSDLIGNFGFASNTIGQILLFLVGWEVLSIITSSLITLAIEKRNQLSRETAWESKSLQTYKHIVSKFIDEALEHYKYHYPEATSLYSFDITNPEQVSLLKKHLIDIHFYL